MIAWRPCALLAILALIGAPTPAATAQNGEEQPPIVFTADELTHDRELGITRASGNVEVIYGDRVLRADTIVYNQRADVVTASGNVALVEPTGEVLFTEYVELTGDLKNGVMADIRAIVSDGARFAASGGRRSGGNRTEMRNAVYSPCDLCPRDPRRAPLWQIKAVRVIHDQEAKDIIYRDAHVEFAGVPVLYTPYLSHPDPTVKRRSGFLIPTIGNSSQLGTIFTVPYYFAISDQRDATITPSWTTKEGPILDVKYRHAFQDARLSFGGSITYDSSDRVRGHVASTYRQDIDETWRLGIDANRASDRTYLRRYGYDSGQRSLRSRGFVEGFWERDYLVANAYTFQRQGTRNILEDTPIVAPWVNYAYVGEPGLFGGLATADFDVAAVSRIEGVQSRRLSSRVGWEAPFRDRLGNVVTVATELWGDGFVVDSQPVPGEAGTFSGVTGRVLPQASLQWQLPLVREDGVWQQVLQPTVEVVAAPRGGNPRQIPNEDSRDFVFEDTNLFGFQRFPGLDRVESGTRVNYGLGWQVFGTAGRSVEALIGQTYRVSDDAVFLPGTGLDRRLSDIVGGVSFAWAPWGSLGYRARFDWDDLRFPRNEVGASVSTGAVALVARYVSFRGQQIDEPTLNDSSTVAREQIDVSGRARLTRYWSATGYSIYDLKSSDGGLVFGAGLAYEDECFFIDATWRRSRFVDQDVEPGNTFLVRLTLKTIGSFDLGL